MALPSLDRCGLTGGFAATCTGGHTLCHRRALCRIPRGRADQCGRVPAASVGMQVCTFFKEVMFARSAAAEGPAGAAGQKVLVFAHHRAVVDQLQCFFNGELASCKMPAIGSVRIDGMDPPQRRLEQQKAFHANPNIQVCVSPSHRSAGAGLVRCRLVACKLSCAVLLAHRRAYAMPGRRDHPAVLVACDVRGPPLAGRWRCCP